VKIQPQRVVTPGKQTNKKRNQPEDGSQLEPKHVVERKNVKKNTP
jgi:hypothetical protein